ncbi:hypothetical protein LCGC14_2054000 [marine sediment metagenome]|uniref:Uncharacterized protein n=1 Tax=marine sediment metagenome TaxID=412755 RepID=A0A0F9H1K4_9ZZZZ
MPEKPTSEKKTLDQVWYGFYGAPGSVGLMARVAAIDDRVQTIEKILNGNGKKPQGLKIMGAAIVGLVGLSELGVLEGLKAVVYNFFSGGSG